MRKAINHSVRLFTECYEPEGPVVELGSFYPPGYQPISDLRPYFRGKAFIGCDIRSGLGVDCIEDAHNLAFSTASVGTILLFEILEHLPRPQQAIDEAYRVLRDDGLLALSVPFHYRLHAFPTDYWRFTASGINTLLHAFPHRIVYSLGPRLKPAFIFAVAGKSEVRDFDVRVSCFREKVQETFRNTRVQGYLSVFKERARDFFGHLLGRAELGVHFFDPEMGGGYLDSGTRDDAVTKRHLQHDD